MIPLYDYQTKQSNMQFFASRDDAFNKYYDLIASNTENKLETGELPQLIDEALYMALNQSDK
ncbi:hypothetical protein [Natranaerobius trueperi]|uniref:Uncharacterized protein n=1 Tax=Natranaerobius trueperi TaxID=759412 RepID=A0A226BV59_9FIRM|nr:hypothetical protein [Natranaerobius trueperi]OWZ82642.1 hypothetical protein CDO51_12995 [Natranaerobius trueperi]